MAGSQLLIKYGSELALLLGVPSSIIGVTMVAIGTSLPELVTTLTAIAKKEASMSTAADSQSPAEIRPGTAKTAGQRRKPSKGP